MARKKNIKTLQEQVRESFEQQNAVAQERREELAKSIVKNTEKDGVDYKKQFVEYWQRKSKELKLPKEIGDAVWAHLKATKNDKPSLFDEGLRHFGVM